MRMSTSRSSHATFYGMTRMRVSTTVDETLWAQAQQLLDVPPSQLVDAALAALVEKLEGQRERLALEQFPYDDDPDLSWEAPPGPQLPYEGEIPEEVLLLARERRRRGAS
jgi:Arc/MetJ family transcription regulator